MVDFTQILDGMSAAFSLVNLGYILAGVLLGQFVGAVPGIGPVVTMAIAIPFTFVLSPLAGISFLIAVNKGGLVGGAIPAILINTPGTPDAAATALDGYPMARAGKPLKATKMALFASITGDTFSDLVLILFAAPLAILALRMGPIEVMSLIIFAVVVLTVLMTNSLPKGITAAAAGLFFSSVGHDPITYTPRLIFGFYEFYDGLPLVSVAIGALAMPEILRRLSDTGAKSTPTIELDGEGDPADRRVSWPEFWGSRFVLLRGAIIGTILGALPGIGSTAAAFMSYASTKAASKEPESFGKGNLHGIAATESANSAVSGANLIPLLTLGIPGNVEASLIVSAFMIHGIQPGPMLFREHGALVYGLFGAMIIANLLNLVVGQLGLRLWVRAIRAPASVIFSAAVLFCLVGTALSADGLTGIWVMLLFSVLGVVMIALDFSVVIFIISFFLGSRLEISLVQSHALLGGNWLGVFTYPVAALLILLSIGMLVYGAIKPFLPKKPQPLAGS
jgi:Uncharacterized protein conserved in bacteria